MLIAADGPAVLVYLPIFFVYLGHLDHYECLQVTCRAQVLNGMLYEAVYGSQLVNTARHVLRALLAAVSVCDISVHYMHTLHI